MLPLMDVYNAATSRRTIRRFKQDRIPRVVLDRMLDAARLAPSGSNLQPCEYVVVTDAEKLQKVFACLKWAGYIAPAGDPPEGQRPTAYVVVLINRRIRETGGAHDSSAAIENMLLVAWEQGVGSCWLGSVDREQVRRILSIPPNYEIDSVVSLGYPNEQPVVEEVKDSIRYWKDERGVLHVPKRALRDLVHCEEFGKGA